MGKYAELIERLERATGPDRGLDYEIHCRDGLEGVGMYGDHPDYTASIDAALTLVPEGSYGFAYPWFYSEYSKHEKPCVFWRAAALRPIWEKATPTLAGDDWFERIETNDAFTPAIAIVIAALKTLEPTNG